MTTAVFVSVVAFATVGYLVARWSGRSDGSLFAGLLGVVGWGVGSAVTGPVYANGVDAAWTAIAVLVGAIMMFAVGELFASHEGVSR